MTSLPSDQTGNPLLPNAPATGPMARRSSQRTASHSPRIKKEGEASSSGQGVSMTRPAQRTLEISPVPTSAVLAGSSVDPKELIPQGGSGGELSEAGSSGSGKLLKDNVPSQEINPSGSEKGQQTANEPGGIPPRIPPGMPPGGTGGSGCCTYTESNDEEYPSGTLEGVVKRLKSTVEVVKNHAKNTEYVTGKLKRTGNATLEFTKAKTKEVANTIGTQIIVEFTLGNFVRDIRVKSGRYLNRLIRRKNVEWLEKEDTANSMIETAKVVKSYVKNQSPRVKDEAGQVALAELNTLGHSLKDLGKTLKEVETQNAVVRKNLQKAEAATNEVLKALDTPPTGQPKNLEGASAEEKVSLGCFPKRKKSKALASLSTAVFDNEITTESFYELCGNSFNHIVDGVSTSVVGVIAISGSNNIVVLCFFGAIGGIIYSGLVIVYLKSRNQTIKLVARLSRIFVSFGAPFGCFLMLGNVFYNYINKKPLYDKWLCFSVFEKQVSFSKTPKLIEETSFAILQVYQYYRLFGFYAGIIPTGLIFLISPNKPQFLVNVGVPLIISVVFYQSFFCWLSYSQNENLALGISCFDQENDFYFLLINLFLGKNPAHIKQEKMRKIQKDALKNTFFFEFIRKIPCLETNCVNGVLNVRDDTFDLFI